jgi:hypothetical protein
MKKKTKQRLHLFRKLEKKYYLVDPYNELPIPKWIKRETLC